jgi:hypothetical protein
MTDIEIIEGNKAIMFFDGAEYATIDILGKAYGCIKYKDSYYPEWNLPKFNEDWNLLMHVVEKIEAIENSDDYEIDIFGNCCEIGTKDEHSTVGKTKKEAVWLAIVSFIKFYNSQIKK